MNELKEILPFVIPFVLINYTLIIVALIDLYKRKKVRFNNKWIWAAIIVFVNLLGSIVYFLARGDDE